MAVRRRRDQAARPALPRYMNAHAGEGAAMTAIVTGGGSGIGRATVERLLAEGLDVAIVDLADALDGARPLVDAASAAGRRLLLRATDASDAAGYEAEISSLIAQLDGVDVLVNSAGVHLAKPALDTDVEEWDRVHAINLRGTFVACRTCGRSMVSRGFGRIINIASVFGLVGQSDRAAYAASKGGVVQLTRALAVEWASEGVTVNAIAPGPTDTPMLASLATVSGRLERVVSGIPTGQVATAAEIAALAAFLARTESGQITGQVIAVDGGYSAA